MSDSTRATSNRVDPSLLQQFEQQGTVYTKPKPSEQQQKVTRATSSHTPSSFKFTGSESSDALVGRVRSGSQLETEVVPEREDDDVVDETDKLVENKDVRETDKTDDTHVADPLDDADEDVYQPKASCCERVTRFFCGCFFSKPKQS